MPVVDSCSFEIPPPMDKYSLLDAIPPWNIVSNHQHQPVEYEIVESSTQCGKPKLVDSSGYSYTIKRKYNNSDAIWRCTMCNKTTLCLATTRQHEMVFTPGPHKHCHQPLVGIGIAAKVSREVKKKAMHNYFQLPGAIVEQVTFSFIAFKQ